MKTQTRFLLILCIGFISSNTLKAQTRLPAPINTPVPGTTAAYATSNSQSLYMGNLLGRNSSLFDSSLIEGSPYLDKEFKTGTVVTDKGGFIDSVSIRFDMLNNEMQYLQNGRQMSIANLKYAQYEKQPADTTSRVIFASGYPAIDNNTERTIYQLVAGGKKIAVLKYVYQKIEDKIEIGYANRKQLVTYKKLYVYRNGSLIPFKNPEKLLQNYFSDYKTRIDAIAAADKLNLNKEQDVFYILRKLDEQSPVSP